MNEDWMNPVFDEDLKRCIICSGPILFGDWHRKCAPDLKQEFLIFCADPSGFYHNPIKHFKWTTTDFTKDDIVFYSDRMVMMPNKIGKIKIALIFEAEPINQEVYNYLKTNYKEFELVFTWDKKLCSIDKRFILISFGTSWISEADYAIYEKSKLVSLVASEKKILPGHQLRHAAAEAFYDRLDLYGRAFNKIDSLLTAFRDYAFTIAIENTNDDCNFSEKIITPFLCGTVPIYYGCPSIGTHFNEKGILSFTTINELEMILNSLSFDRYQNMLPYVRENFEIAKTHQLVDDTIFSNLIELGLV